jgi:hypothetical protein
MVDVTMPPMIGAAIGFITSEPTPLLHMIGTRLAMTTVTVISELTVLVADHRRSGRQRDVCQLPQRNAGTVVRRIWCSAAIARLAVRRSKFERRRGLSCKELQRLGHEVRVKLEHPTMSGIGIDDEVAVRKAPGQVVRVLAWHHAIAVAVCNEHRLVNL